jgi:hypothetical protein
LPVSVFRCERGRGRDNVLHDDRDTATAIAAGTKHQRDTATGAVTDGQRALSR